MSEQRRPARSGSGSGSGGGGGDGKEEDGGEGGTDPPPPPPPPPPAAAACGCTTGASGMLVEMEAVRAARMTTDLELPLTPWEEPWVLAHAVSSDRVSCVACVDTRSRLLSGSCESAESTGSSRRSNLIRKLSIFIIPIFLLTTNMSFNVILVKIDITLKKSTIPGILCLCTGTTATAVLLIGVVAGTRYMT